MNAAATMDASSAARQWLMDEIFKRLRYGNGGKVSFKDLVESLDFVFSCGFKEFRHAEPPDFVGSGRLAKRFREGARKHVGSLEKFRKPV
jgi:hypothetical protein